MKLIFADPKLRRAVDSSTSWYHYVVPELQNYWTTPEVWAHENFPGSLDPFLVRTEFGQKIPEPLEIQNFFGSDPGEATFEQIRADRNTCLFLRDASPDFAQAVLDWLNRIGPEQRPKVILELATQCRELSALDALQIAAHSEAAADVKFIATDSENVEYWRSALGISVDCWPSPVTARVQPKYTAGKPEGRLFAIVANHSDERGERLLPALAEALLTEHQDAALLIHHSQAVGPEIQRKLAEFESANRRLVYLPSPLPLKQWLEILAAVDLAILPYDPCAYQNRPSWLLDELVANGIPSLVPASTTLSKRIESFGISECVFDRHNAQSIVSAVSKVVGGYERVSNEFHHARQQWERTHGAMRFVQSILSWFPKPRVKLQAFPQLTTAGNRSKRILLSWAVDPSYLPPPRFSENQITVGPHPFSTAKAFLRPNHAQSFASYTPFFHTYDLKQVVEAQGIKGPFDLVIVSAEATFGNTPLNAKAFGCPTLLYAGDTHWGKSVIQRMTGYAVAGEFDYVVTTYNRQHMHWYKEAGKKQVAWIPGLGVQHLPGSSSESRKRRIAFSGQRAGNHHTRRRRLLAALDKAGLPLDARSVSREESAALYNSSLVSLNVSMNGDLNLRTFEVMSAGGCLLTDRLSPESGQSLLFDEEFDFACYSTDGELLEVARRLLADPGRAVTIAAKGRKKYTENYLPERQIGILLDWVFSGNIPVMYGSDSDARLKVSDRNSVPFTDRMMIYEKLQFAHQEQENVRVLLASDVPACIATDMIDLPRLSCFILQGDGSVKPALSELGLADRVTFLPSIKAAKQKAPWSFLLTTGKSLDLQTQLAHAELIIVPVV
jgi:hypothetical protein